MSWQNYPLNEGLQTRRYCYQQRHQLKSNFFTIFSTLSCKQRPLCNIIRSKSDFYNSWWCLFWCFLAAQLLFANQMLAQTADIYLQQNIINSHPIAHPPLIPKNNGRDDFVRPPLSTEKSENIIDDIHVQGERRAYVSISDIDKEVVERLIKQWAPVVWLAPEEKFMPLGVEEFLANVHPESKDKPFTPGMPLGDSSEKSYLVTNAEIDQLLENETSFLYGRNPNVSPVPIYAVVTLCDNEQQNEQKSMPQLKQNAVLPQTPPTNVKILPQELNYLPPVLKKVATISTQLHGITAPNKDVPKATRGPYIPVTLGPHPQVENTVRRSSRLYPVFQRVKRNIPSVNPKYIHPSPPISSHDLVIGESAPTSELVFSPIPPKQPAIPTESENNESEGINNFIANLADNVKFSIPYTDQENVLVHENSHLNRDFAYKEGTPAPSFHVTYWMFYPYSQGKNMCTLSLGPFGRIPFPAVYGYCLGRKKDIGSHIGDWEHMTLYFSGNTEPEAMYVSAHDAGAYYAYNRLTGSFEFRRQETRKGILQRPNFPKTVTTFNDHPVLFAAKGSHGIWTAPGKHRFVKVARLYDINGFGTPWNTWKSIDVTYENLRSYGRSLAPTWLSFKGRWGNPKSKCHPLRRVGLNFCEFADGPTGIPLKEPHFQCGDSYRRR